MPCTFSSILVRGHNVFWAVERHVPAWQLTLSPAELLQAIHTRVQGVIGHTKGKYVIAVTRVTNNRCFFLHQPMVKFSITSLAYVTEGS
jgi:hypothetical protein